MVTDTSQWAKRVNSALVCLMMAFLLLLFPMSLLPFAVISRADSWHLSSSLAHEVTHQGGYTHDRLWLESSDLMANSSLLEYARYNRLAIDHKAEDLRTYFKPFAPRGFPDEASLLPFELPHAYRNLPEEKFQFSQDAGKLLAEATTAPKCSQSSQLLADPHKIQKMKMEVTMLRSNHEKDMRWFRSGVDLDKMFQAEVQAYDREDEEDSHPPDIVSSCTRAMGEVKKELFTERLEVGMEALNLLRQSTRSTCTEVERDQCMQSQLSHAKASLPVLAQDGD